MHRLVCAALTVHLRGVVCCAAVVLVAPASAQQRDPSKDDILHAYEELVAKYQAGDDAAITALESWPSRQVETAVTRIDDDGDEWRPWTAPQRIAAAMLHTDLAVRRLANSDRGATQFHLNVACKLLQEGSAKTRSERQAFEARWYPAAGRSLRLVDPPLAEYILERGRDRLPGTVAILYQSALVATDKAVAYANFAGVLRAEPIGRENGMTSTIADVHRQRELRQVPRQAREALAEAERWLAEATDLSPTDDGIRLHHAYVRLLGGHERDTIEEAGRVQQRTREPRLAYVAALLAGAASEGRHDYAAAAGSYRAATLTWPRGQHAYIALSEVLARQALRDKAAEVLERLLTGPNRGEFDEPWWHFVVGESEETDTFADLRQEARQ